MLTETPGLSVWEPGGFAGTHPRRERQKPSPGIDSTLPGHFCRPLTDVGQLFDPGSCSFGACVGLLASPGLLAGVVVNLRVCHLVCPTRRRFSEAHMPPTIAGAAMCPARIGKQSAMRTQYMVRIMPKTRMTNFVVIYIFDVLFRFTPNRLLAQMMHNVIKL
ncbi:MAG: hypothetical protein ACJ8BC_01155 [Gemmatimonadales bacterium]